MTNRKHPFITIRRKVLAILYKNNQGLTHIREWNHSCSTSSVIFCAKISFKCEHVWLRHAYMKKLPYVEHSSSNVTVLVNVQQQSLQTMTCGPQSTISVNRTKQYVYLSKSCTFCLALFPLITKNEEVRMSSKWADWRSLKSLLTYSTKIVKQTRKQKETQNLIGIQKHKE